MEYSTGELTEAKRQIDSTLHKLRSVIGTLESKADKTRCRSQITLASRRIKAFEIAAQLIEKELSSREEAQQVTKA